jgi:hypothetical protein
VLLFDFTDLRELLDAEVGGRNFARKASVEAKLKKKKKKDFAE